MNTNLEDRRLLDLDQDLRRGRDLDRDLERDFDWEMEPDFDLVLMSRAVFGGEGEPDADLETSNMKKGY